MNYEISVLTILVAILWFGSASLDYSEFCYIWQLKEYRWDRIKDFFNTKQGRDFRFSYQLFWRSLAAFILFLWPINQTEIFEYILLVFFAVDWALAVRKKRNLKLRFPRKTKKAVAIIAFSLAIEGILIISSSDKMIILGLIIARFFILSGAVSFFNKLTVILKKIYIRRATKKMLNYPNLTVIGITGSFGKTTTKEYLAHILSGKCNVARTPLHVNTEIGVAQYILRTDFRGMEVFVVEMGAYRVGEIKQICDIVRPKIGVLLAINEQHLSLFGSIENTQKAKYELLQCLPPDGLAVVNNDNIYCRGLLDTIRCETKTFGLEEEFKPNFLIEDIYKDNKGEIGLSFRGKYQDENFRIKTSIVMSYSVFNVAPGVIIARHLGLSWLEINERTGSLSLASAGVKTFIHKKCVVIDDSYNSNPAGFKAALDFLSEFSSGKKRIVVTRGMLELGSRSDELHEIVGGEIAFSADQLVIISPDYAIPLSRGVGSKYQTEIILKYRPEALMDFLEPLKNQDCVILLENRLPISVYKNFIKDFSPLRNF
ncbi:MAG: Mur ligase family protein [Patescibacteria group bacterium]